MTVQQSIIIGALIVGASIIGPDIFLCVSQFSHDRTVNRTS
jgi:hypothetical protein